jgi:triosephosphate isomerase (TIM)
VTVIGISLKMYFGYRQTLDWCRQVASLARDRTADELEMFVLPSFPALPEAGRDLALAGIGLGAQDLSADDNGAQTGEVGGAMLAELGCRYVEVGHAERRRLFHETESVVADKTAAALRHGLTPVLCLGEVEEQSANSAAAECSRQLESALAVSRAAGSGGRLVLAYEPHWAIGAPAPAPDAHISTVCAALGDAVAGLPEHPGSAVIYGGSAGPGLMTRVAGHADGLFLGRFAHEPAALAAVLDEVVALAHREVSA